MTSKHKASSGPSAKALKALEPLPNVNTYHLLKSNAGEPHESWWLGLDRDQFSAKQKNEAPRMVSSAMARRLG